MDEELYIRMENGRPVDHPMLRSNIETAFPDVDFDNLPNWLCRFERIERPAVGVYEIANGPIYVQDGDLVRDQWIVRPMTEDEIIIKQNRVQRYFATDNGHLTTSWVFDSETCSFRAPVAMPTDGKNYTWHEPSRSWVEIPDPVLPAIIEGEDGSTRKPYPMDGGFYQWDATAFEWIPRAEGS
jgi:hypothetical protein